jgi:hypothetical protein
VLIPAGKETVKTRNLQLEFWKIIDFPNRFVKKYTVILSIFKKLVMCMQYFVRNSNAELHKNQSSIWYAVTVSQICIEVTLRANTAKEGKESE